MVDRVVAINLGAQAVGVIPICDVKPQGYANLCSNFQKPLWNGSCRLTRFRVTYAVFDTRSVLRPLSVFFICPTSLLISTICRGPSLTYFRTLVALPPLGIHLDAKRCTRSETIAVPRDPTS